MNIINIIGWALVAVPSCLLVGWLLFHIIHDSIKGNSDAQGILIMLGLAAYGGIACAMILWK